MQLNNNFDDLAKKLEKENTSLKSLETFFKESAKQCDSGSRSLVTLLPYLRTESGSVYSLQMALLMMTREMEEFADGVHATVEMMHRDIVGPLGQYRDVFHKQSMKYAKAGNDILAELHKARKQAESTKDLYTKSSMRFEQIQTDIKSMVASASGSGNSFNSTMEHKTSTILLRHKSP